MRYNYLENIKNDIIEYVKENDDYLKEKNLDDLYDIFFCEDAITGNASGSYYCNAWRAEEAISHNMELLTEALECFGCDNINVLEKGAEWCDVTIRCYLLGQALNEVKEEIEEILKDEK